MTLQYSTQLGELVMRKLDPFARQTAIVKEAWDSITNKVNESLKKGEIRRVNVRQTRDRAQDLFKDFKSREAESKSASGTDEAEPDDLDKLLAELQTLLLEGEAENEKKKAELKRKEELGHTIRDTAMKRLKDKKKDIEEDSDDDEEMPKLSPLAEKNTGQTKRSSAKKRKLDSMSSFLEERNKIRKLELEVRQKELEIQERRAEAEDKKTEAMLRMMTTVMEGFAKGGKEN